MNIDFNPYSIRDIPKLDNISDIRAKISGVMESLVRQQNDWIMSVISVESADNPKFIDKKIIDRCQMIIENPGVNEIKTFCFDDKPLLRFGPITTMEDDGKIYFEQTVERL